MRVMVVYAHPVETSFNAAIFATVQESLRAGGHEVDACDLYAENFPAIMSRDDRLLYHKVPDNRVLARPWIERLETMLAEFPGALLLVTHDDALARRVTDTRWALRDRRVWTHSHDVR